MPRPNLFSEENKAKVGPLVPAVLSRARDLLSDRKRWIAGWKAKDDEGRSVMPESPDAATWCAVGAIERCAWAVWSAQPDADTWSAGSTVLANQASNEALKHIREAASMIRPGLPGIEMDSIPNINDHPRRGGYQAVINGLCLATGKAPVDDLDAIKAAFEKRAAASRKGWEKRRRREAAEAHAAHQRWLAWRAEQAAAKAEKPMIIAGTNVPVSPTINADAKEVTV